MIRKTKTNKQKKKKKKTGRTITIITKQETAELQNCYCILYY